MPRPGGDAEGRATVAPGPVFAISDVLIVPNGTERQTTLRKRFVTVGINAE